MDKYKIIYSADTWNDLKQIHNYIALNLQSPSTAASQINQIRNAIKGLDMLPKRYNVVDFEPWKSVELRKLPINNYLVFYLVDEANSIIRIIGVIYSRRNAKKILTYRNNKEAPTLYVHEERKSYEIK